jgi:hypothetical protein
MYYVTIIETAVRRLTKIVQESLNWEQQSCSQCIRATKSKYDSLHPGPLRGITLTCSEYNERAYKHTKNKQRNIQTNIHTYIHNYVGNITMLENSIPNTVTIKPRKGNFQSSTVTLDSLYQYYAGRWPVSNVHLIGYIWLFGNESASSASHTWLLQGHDQR